MIRSWLSSLRYSSIRAAMKLPVPMRRRLTWLTQATFTVGVSALLLNENNQMLLLRHRFREHHGWELPGGFVGRGENLEDALCRELREETGYQVEVQSLLSVQVSRSHHLDVRYLARVLSGALTIEREEILDARFFAVDDLSDALDPDEVSTVVPVVDAEIRRRLETGPVGPGGR